MTHKDEALKLALEALAIADNIALVGVAYTPKSIDLGLLKIRGASDAIKQALAAQPEPVQPKPEYKFCDDGKVILKNPEILSQRYGDTTKGQT
jgi:hypothetical protein